MCGRDTMAPQRRVAVAASRIARYVNSALLIAALCFAAAHGANAGGPDVAMACPNDCSLNGETGHGTGNLELSEC
jgi:hypothetical protein